MNTRDFEREMRKRNKYKPANKVTVSDHALLRYLERIYGFDFNKIRCEILTPETVAAIKTGVVTIKRDGYEMRIRQNTITTII